MSALHELELKHLVALDAVASAGTFSRAAERLGYTQSAVSQQIASLERVMGAPVFDRPGGPRPVELTPLGERLLDHGRSLLAQVEMVVTDIRRFQQGHVGRLDIGTFQSVSATILPVVVGRMLVEYPDVELNVFESDQDLELEGRLARGELDVSFVVSDDLEGIETRRVASDPFVLIARPGQFPPGPVRLADLAGEPMIGQHASSCQIQNEAGLRGAGVDPSYVFRSNDNGTVSAMVRAGMGVAVLPMLCAEPEDHRTELHPLVPALPDRRISIAWRADRTLSPAAERFVELAETVGRELTSRVVIPA
ncbi:MAG: LysR family transcriptional regulator [Ilumatobacteraceae bacterium]